MIYLLITLVATTVGSLTGMGGGVIIKPAMDAIGEYDAATIGVLTAVTVLTMSVTSVIKQFRQKANVPWKSAILLACGSMTGGMIGQKSFDEAVRLCNANQYVLVIQNICLGILITLSFFYMLNKEKIQSKHISSMLAYLLAGIILGVFSSFLGIGGGPINVVILTYLFSMPTKSATVCSIITILFAQFSKLSLIALTVGFWNYDLSCLPFMIISAIAGGLIGSKLNKSLSEKNVEIAFNGVQIVVLVVCIWNIIRNI